MASESPYLTKEDFREEMKHYATKADLANLETRLTRLMLLVGIGVVGAMTLIQKFVE